MTADELPERFRLSFLLGEVVRNDVYAEHEMRLVWNVLEDAGLGDGLERQRDFGRLIRQVRKMIVRSEVPDTFRTIASDVIEATHQAHLYRRDLVHDLLTECPQPRGVALSVFRNHSPRPLEEIDRCGDDLKRASWRLRGLWIIAPSWVGGSLDEYRTVADLQSWTRVAMGNIRDDPGVIVGTAGPSPEPPGGYSDGVGDELSDMG